MRNEARALTSLQREAVAVYLRSLTKNSVTLPTMAPNGGQTPGIVQLSLGANIVQFGTSSGVTACAVCHGRILQGNAATDAPALAGEPKGQTLVDAMATGKIGKTDAMQNIARLLTPEQREAVAAFVERVTPIKPHH
jgi:cytochrome c553